MPTAIKAILPNCGHYNTNTRKESLTSLLKLVKEADKAALVAPEMLALLDGLLGATFRLICDDDVNVRNALVALISCLFERYPADNLTPFFARWMSFLSLATSHIKMEIRRDSVKFVSLTLRNQKHLLLPHIPTLLIAMLPLVSVFPVGTGARSSPAYDCYVALIDAYLAPFLAREERAEASHSTPLASFTWPAVAEIIRVSPYASAGNFNASTLVLPPAMTPVAVKQVISHLSALSISVWLDSSHLLSGVIISKSLAASNDYKQLQTLLALYRKLWRLAERVLGDEQVFWTSLPPKIAKCRPLLQEELNKR